MLDFLFVLDEVRRSDGAIRLPPGAPTEVPPWTKLPRAGIKRRPNRPFRLTINPPHPNDRGHSSTLKTAPSSDAADGLRIRVHYDYTATPLSQGPDGHEIRILRLLPGKPSDPLRCQLARVPLAQAGPYDAISYCWGSPSPGSMLDCDGVLVPITSNLTEALKAFRLPDSPRSLWVDALCIDQQNPKEKKYQVPLMGYIYRAASTVRIWLGHDTPGVRLTEALEILGKVYALCIRFGWDLDFPYIMLFDYGLWEESGLPDMADDAWRSIRYLIEMPWFSRTWIIQEVLLSHEAYLHSSRTSLPFVQFCVGLLALSREFFILRPDIIPSMTAYAQVTELMLSYHKARSRFTKLNLLALLENHRISQASLTKDKIFAFLGIHEVIEGHEEGHWIVVDYESTTKHVYVSTAERIIRHTNSLEILGAAGRRSSGLRQLPSWVPDWSASDLTSPLSYKTIDGTYLHDFNATGRKPGDGRPSVAKFNGEKLELSGFCFDEVTKVGDVADLPFRKDCTSISVAAIVPQIAALLLSHLRTAGDLRPGRKYPDGRERLEAFIRTISLDDTPTDKGMEVAPELYQLMHAPSRALIQRWSGRSKLDTLFYTSMLLFMILRLLGPGGFKLLVRVAKKMEDTVPLTFIVNTKYSKPDEVIDREQQMQGYRILYVPLRSLYRRLFTTKRGYMGLGPKETCLGDQVFLVQGSRTPLMFRETGLGQRELIGDCYVCGIMQGEAFQENKCGPFTVV